MYIYNLLNKIMLVTFFFENGSPLHASVLENVTRVFTIGGRINGIANK